MTDGGFEQTTCPVGGDGASCTNPSWAETPRQSFVCHTPACLTNAFNFPRTGAGWLQLGGQNYVDPPGNPQFDSGTLTQSIVIPEAPATLRFWLRSYVPSPGDTNTGLSVSIDLSEVFVLQFLAGQGSSNPVGYVERAVDVSNFVGAGPKTLEFDTFCRGSTMSACGVFLIDDVSITTGIDPPTTTPTTTPATTPTINPAVPEKCTKKKRKPGKKRAAAAECKKKKKKAKKKA